MASHSFIPYNHPVREISEIKKISTDFFTQINKRRSIRDFSATPIPREIIADVILTASSAPSGAHKQPWTFCAISSPSLKKKIRVAAEKEEKINYESRMSESWKHDLEPFGTDWRKPFLEIAPWLIIVFKKSYDLMPDGQKKKNYYVNESVGIATGFLIAAIHNAGLAALTHTPSPMNFLEKILDRPQNERAFLLIPVGYPSENAKVPDITRKKLEDISVFYENE